MFRGLFVGVDRYAPPVTRLSCAVADAVALAALFEDNTDGDFTTLLNERATLSGLRSGLGALATSHEDDFVVVTFSGHGSDDHRLVPSDVNPSDLPGSCLSLAELAGLLDAIPARQLLVVLDCCFSGGFGGSRHFAQTAARGSLIEDRGTLVRLARGDGRVVIAASAAGEPALETEEYGHGLLTHYLLRALQGPPGLQDNGRVGLLELFGHVARDVLDAAKRMGEQQNPSVYGSTDGAPTLPVLRPGRAYAKAFPGRVHPPVDASWESLGPRGIPTDVTAVWASQMPSPNELQRSAVNDFGVLDGDSLLVVAPTGSGKTMIGELAAVQHALRGSRTVMLLPMRALVNDKYEHFSRTYGQGLAVVRATGEVSDQVGDLLGGHFDIALLTYEKFLALLIAFPHILRGVSLVVVDEAQNISDPGRGPDLELLMTLLRSGHARGGAPQMVALSAVISDTHGLERWLGAGLLRSDSRPVPLRESVVDAAGAARHLLPDGTESREPLVVPWHGTGSQASKPVVVPLVARLVAEGKKIIVFRPFKGETVGTAKYLAEALGGPPARAALDALPAGDPSSASVDLRQVLAAGVGFHNSDLDRDERRVLETAFRDPASDLRVIVATTTLAMGINTPAEAVVIAGLMHPGNQPYSVAEYKNMAGRAGRPGFAAAGESYIVAADRLSPSEAWDRYVTGRPEDVRSHFLAAGTDPQTLILRALTALGRSVLEPELVDLLNNSFAVWQLLDRGQSGWDEQALRFDLDALVRAELVDREPNGEVTLTRLGQYAGESGLQVRSVTNVSSALRWARAPLSAADLVLLAQVTAETDQTLLPVHARSKQEQARWPATVARLGAQRGLVNAMHVGGGFPLPRCKKAAACLLFASESPLSAVEAELMQHLRGASAAGPVRSVASRTRDVLGAVAMIASVKGVDPADDALADDLAVMLEIGLPRRLATVGAVLGDALTRAQYLALDRHGLGDAASIREAGPGRLAEVIGSAAAAAALARLSRPGGG